MKLDGICLVVFCLLSTFSELKSQKPKSADFQCGVAFNRKINKNSASQDPTTASLGSSPWHVAVYAVKADPDPTKKLDLKCGGSIITENAIVTAADCVFVEGKRIFVKADTIAVIAGRTLLTLNSNVEHAQVRKVKKIHSHSSYQGEITGYSENMVVLEIDPYLIFNDYILPLCLDWVQRRSSKASVSKDYQEIAGWGLRQGALSDNLLETAWDVQENRKCRTTYKALRLHRYINYDKFCVITPLGRAKEDEGAGLVMESGGRYYLQGILSANLNQQFSVATNISKHLGWLQDVMTRIGESCPDGFLCQDQTCLPLDQKCNGVSDCPDKSDESSETCREIKRPEKEKRRCVLPIQLGGASYSLENCKEGLACNKLPGTSISSGQRILMVCGRGTVASEKGPRYACLEGEWFQEEPKCRRMCPPRKRRGVSIVCTYNRKVVPCKDYMLPGTEAVSNCQKLYKVKDPLLLIEKSTCLEGGKWSAELPECFPECGVPNPSRQAIPTITFGKNVTYGKYPWHVALLRREKENADWEQSCGGTIIAPNLILTAAHCLYSQATEEIMSAENFLIAAGKVRREWSILEIHQQSSRPQSNYSTRYQQDEYKGCSESKSTRALSGWEEFFLTWQNCVEGRDRLKKTREQVKELIVPESYEGVSTQYEFDIALLDLVTPFEVTDFVLPCCLDFQPATPTGKAPTGDAIVMGWGFSEFNLHVGSIGTSSPQLIETKLPLISNSECRKLDRNFLAFITFDKFCGLYRNGSGPQGGDSGGGVIMRYGDLYFVVGVISTKQTYANDFGAFTSVSAHLEWLKDVVRTHRKL